MRGALGPDGQLYQAFPLGGPIRSLIVNATTWTEFDTQDGDLFLIETPVLAGGRIVHTNSATHPGLVDGAPVSAETLSLSITVFRGQDILSTDRSTGAAKLFYAIADVVVAPGDPAVEAVMKFARAA